MRILVVEDDAIIREGIVMKLERAKFAVDEAEDGDIALELIYENTYDCILLDINLPDMTGYDVCRALREMTVSTPVIMVTARDEVVDKIRGLDEGADDYMSKPFDFDELLARIRAVIRRNHGKSSPKLSCKTIEIDPAQHQVTVAGSALDLTKKEYGIIYHLLSTHPAPQSLETIIEHVWDEEANPFSNAARVHIANLRRKLEKESDVRIQVKKEVGYYLE